MKITKFDDPNGIVSKLVFEDEHAVAETVIYSYGYRNVICFSTQSGCKVGCSFCGTGKRFIRDLTLEEMNLQIQVALEYLPKVDDVQIMPMSMGEPTEETVWPNLLEIAVAYLKEGYSFFVSTVGLSNPDAYRDMIGLGQIFPKFGLQFSLHELDNDKRKKLLGNYDKLLDLDQIINYGRLWSKEIGKKCYFNYICKKTITDELVDEIKETFKGMHVTCSALCKTGKVGQGITSYAKDLFEKLKDSEVETSLFDPAGQDTIGGGCGQLAYSQSKLSNTNSFSDLDVIMETCPDCKGSGRLESKIITLDGQNKSIICDTCKGAGYLG